MMKYTIFLVLFYFFSALSASAQVSSKFKKVLKKNKLEFIIPIGFEEITALPNTELEYQGALKHGLDPFEVRYSVYPLDAKMKEFKKNLKNPKVKLAHPNFFWKQKYVEYIHVLSKIQMVDIKTGREFKDETVQEEFHGDGGAVTLFQMSSESFAPEYQYCLMMVLHKNFECDVYICFLGNDPEVIEKLALEAFHAIQFKQ